jgi:hypothetical protein
MSETPDGFMHVALGLEDKFTDKPGCWKFLVWDDDLVSIPLHFDFQDSRAARQWLRKRFEADADEALPNYWRLLVHQSDAHSVIENYFDLLSSEIEELDYDETNSPWDGEDYVNMGQDRVVNFYDPPLITVSADGEETHTSMG